MPAITISGSSVIFLFIAPGNGFLVTKNLDKILIIAFSYVNLKII